MIQIKSAPLIRAQAEAENNKRERDRDIFFMNVWAGRFNQNSDGSWYSVDTPWSNVINAFSLDTVISDYNAAGGGEAGRRAAARRMGFLNAQHGALEILNAYITGPDAALGLWSAAKGLKSLGSLEGVASNVRSEGIAIPGANRKPLTQGALDSTNASRAEEFNPGRLPRSQGRWGGAEGNSPWYSKVDEVNTVTKGAPVPFRNGYPDFAQWSVAKVRSHNLSGFNEADFPLADRALAMAKGWLKRDGTPNASAAARFRQANGLTWHHVPGGDDLLLVPTPLHANVPHIGGASDLRSVVVP